MRKWYQFRRLAVESGGVTRLCISQTLRDSSGLAVDEALFRSRLARLKSTLDYEREMLTKAGEIESEPESDRIIGELVVLGRRAVSKELVKEFEALLGESDKLRKDAQKAMIEEYLQNNPGREYTKS